METLDPALRHGGALDAAIANFGGRREDWLDLSTGINPAPPPMPALSPTLWQRLPEAELETRAIAAARFGYGAPPEAGIVAAPGTQALIAALPSLLPRNHVAILEPTYSGHRLAFETAGYEVIAVAALAAVPADATIVVVVNPNNPDGRVHEPADLLALAERLAARGGLLVVDEAFADADGGRSVAFATGRPGLLVYRSFGKFFGLAGLRLGFALTTPGLADALRGRLGAWAVSGPALAVGAAWLGDAKLCANVRARIAGQHALLAETLAGAGLTPVGGTHLFLTIHHPDAAALFAALCRRHILTRPFAYRGDWLRIGNVADAVEARRLGVALSEALGEIAA
ncbi:threonine-phosphate decarboxylase CobD [Aurantimonas endophytica]|uniref:threonine-phosphate decarboxylase n=1 Tax=Aurantimonas endophytica TaxID=1522175 RepID=A0A7W6MP34_9HYPH|nr:threonine-phosphate decarboxylase CobD [Aurantimonas endophytica]MBB4002523.1 cobalamin biosynthetic protein CobC [Aurantimonas endophytica]MCO6403404.1 threonine-phosphate decarboxylase [Aurantimonas endophytica]